MRISSCACCTTQGHDANIDLVFVTEQIVDVDLFMPKVPLCRMAM